MYIPATAKSVIIKKDDGKDKIVGVSISRESDIACDADPENPRYMSIEQIVMCDESVTGLAYVLSVE